MEYSTMFYTQEHYKRSSTASTSIKSSTAFSISMLPLKSTSSSFQQINAQPPQLQQQQNPPITTNELIFSLEPQQSTIIQLKFRPDEIGMHENALIIRNNLTILDAYVITGEAGTAELRINDKEPMRTSILFNSKLTEMASQNFKLADTAKLDMQMNEVDFELCKGETKQRDTKQSYGFGLLGATFY
jgi:hypothetical protein